MMRREFDELPPEYSDALLPLAHQTDIVVVPIAGNRPLQELPATGWRGWAITVVRGWLAHLQRTAPGPDAVNAGPRHFIADLLYETIAILAGWATRRAWQAHLAHLAGQVLDVVRRDPGCRVLVVVNVRHCHHLRHALRQHPEVQVVDYLQL